MIKHTQQIAIFAVPNETAAKGFDLQICPINKLWWMNDGDIKLSDQPVTVYVDIPDEKTLIVKAVETLRDRQKAILAESQQNVDKLQDRIDKLLMLAHKRYENVVPVDPIPEEQQNDTIIF